MRFVRPYVMALGILAFSAISSAQTESISNDCTGSRIQIVPGAGQTYVLMQDEAEHALNCLARVSDKEDSWVYTGYELIDVGRDEDIHSVNIDNDLFYSTACDLNFGVLKDYHIHPLKNTISDEISPPSLTDIEFHVAHNEMLRKKGGSLISFVCDGKGIWQYSVDLNTIGSLVECSDEEVYVGDDFLSDTFRMFVDINELCISREEKILLYVDYFASWGIELSYRPME